MEDYPKDKSAGDVVYEVARGVVSAAPVVGGPAQVLLENVFSAPLDKRREDWFTRLAGVINEILERVIDLEATSLGENEAFVTTALQATQIALRNHSTEKLSALRNAVLNAGLPNAPSDDEQAIFLRLVDELTPLHLRILVFLRDPTKAMSDRSITPPNWHSGSTSIVLEFCFPELQGHEDLYSQMVRDLVAAGLAPQGNYMHAGMTASGMVAPRTTTLGDRFLSFITEPS